jgi:hypothetical protein
MATDNDPGEFGGYPGLIQPEPHPLTGIEEARLMRSLDPADGDDNLEAARERGGAQRGGRSSQRTGGPVPGGSVLL